MRCVSFVGLLAACGGCGATGDASGLDLISDQPLEGLINGEAWTYTGGDDDGSVTFNGTVRVDRIDDDEIAGGVYAILDDDNQVDGTFTISRCASE